MSTGRIVLASTLGVAAIVVIVVHDMQVTEKLEMRGGVEVSWRCKHWHENFVIMRSYFRETRRGYWKSEGDNWLYPTQIYRR